MKQQKPVQNNNSALKRYFKLSIAIPILGIAVLFFSCANDIETIKAYSSDEKKPTMIAEDFETIRSDSTIITHKMNAPKMIRFEDDKKPFLEFPEGVHIQQFDKKMNIISSIQADYAKYFEKEQKWIAKNNVIAVNADNDTLKTDELTRDEGKGKIYSEQFVKIIRKDQIITGIGLEADQDLSHWKILNPKGTLYIDVEE